MKAPLFEFPSYQYEVSDWEFKKKRLLNHIDKNKFYRTELQPFETDRTKCLKSYLRHFEEIFSSELSQFAKEAKCTCSLTDVWSVKYQKGDHQTVHNHRGWGFSGILYVEYDPKVHTPTCFVAPWQEPRTDTTSIASPARVKEGTMFIAPSWALHFVKPNHVRKSRMVVVFDILPQIPLHQLPYVKNDK
tara:strand:- start:389 stop:955 length:567 start_codon:yes stop_codon:yes gene_type:complete